MPPIRVVANDPATAPAAMKAASGQTYSRRSRPWRHWARAAAEALTTMTAAEVATATCMASASAPGRAVTVRTP